MLNILRNNTHLVRPVRSRILGALVCGAVFAALSGFGLPFMVKKVLPVLFAEGGRQDLLLLAFPETVSLAGYTAHCGWAPWIIPAEHLLAFSIAILPVVFLLRGVAGFGKDYLLNSAGLRVLEALRIAIFTKLQHLHLDFFRKIPSGDILSRMNGDAMLVRTALVDVLADLVIQPLTLLAAIGYVIYEANKVPGMGGFLAALAVIPLSVLPIRYLGKKLRRRSKDSLRKAGDINSLLVESLQAPREIRAYNLQEREIGRYRAQTGQFLRLQLKQVKYLKMQSPIIEVLAATGISFAIYQATRVNIKQDTVIALVVALYMCYEPVKRLGAVSNRLRQSDAAMERLRAIADAPIEVADPASPQPLPSPARGEIVFDRVDFTYPASDRPLFQNLSLRIAPGEIVALVGPSGSGKSTFANLVPRFYDVSSGGVHVDGADVRTVAQSQLRSRIAIVSQEPILFSDTITANLRLGKPDATDAEIREAARKAGALDFIESMPQGFDTPVGERGGLLSGGQRQRLAIARAFLKDAPILILDEATSALDSETEAQVQEALERLARGKTVLIIAHRFSTIRFATRILVFDKAACGVAADGSHEELLESSPLYKALWAHQQTI